MMVIANLGVTQADGSKTRRVRALNLTALIAFSFSTGWSIVWAVVSVVESYAALWSVIATSLIGSAAYVVVLILNARRRLVAATWVLVISAAFSVGLAGVFFGFAGGVWLYLLLLPVLAALYLSSNNRGGLVIVIGGGSILFAVVAALAGEVPGEIADTTLLTVLFFTSAFGTALTAAVLFLYYRNLADRAEARSEWLLLNILPEHIVQRLKAGEYPIADRIPEVTVLFADIVASTKLADRLSPNDLVRVLDGLFSAFDSIVEEHDLEKIKTAGDAYVAVAGLKGNSSDSVKHAADTALRMREELDHHSVPGSGEIQMRFGIHLGPVVAGVIGKRKFSYDLWGDTMNVASRMESTGLPNSIQVTSQIYERLAAEYIFEPRKVDLKGKGEIETYMLINPR